MQIRSLLYITMAAGLVMTVIVEWSNLYQPYDEGLEVTLFLIVLLALTLLYRDDKMKKPTSMPA
jgi:hypothetical protein